MVRKTDIALKNFIQEVGVLIDSRFKLFEINLKAYIRSEITASEERRDKKLNEMNVRMATKEDIKDMATKQDIERLESKIDETNILLQGQLNNLDMRVKKLEATGVKARN